MYRVGILRPGRRSLLYCTLEEVQPGMTVAASVMHPRRADTELLSRGFELDGRTLKRLKQLEVRRVWVHHDAAADLDRVLDADAGQSRRRVAAALRERFDDLSHKTLTVASVVHMRQLVMDLLCELTANRKLAALTEQMVGFGGDLFTHGSSVAYLSIVCGLELETYVVQQRPRLTTDRARDLTGLGLGAMLHDIGKLPPPEEARDADRADLTAVHAADVDFDQLLAAGDPKPALKRYLDHPRRGFNLLKDKRAPASATQVVLTHHRLYDGRGFPDVDPTGGEREGSVQQGRGIHVFSRIAAAADALDALLRRDPDRPPVAALSDIRGERFHGWFDPVVLDTLVRRLPPFALGSRVVLSDGRAAAVIAPSLYQPCRPTVRLLDEADRLPDGSFPTFDLRGRPEVWIAEAQGRDVTPWLFELPEQEPLSLKAASQPLSGAA